MPAVFVAGVAVIGGQIGCNAYAARLYPTYIRATGIGWALGIGRFGSILGVTVGGLMLAAQWSVPSLFQTSAVPQLCSALVILGLCLSSACAAAARSAARPSMTSFRCPSAPEPAREHAREHDMKNIQTQVLIVGAGPVGLTAAMDLAARGIEVVVAEMRRAGEPPEVKCNHVSARSMEIFRRLGIVRRGAKCRTSGGLSRMIVAYRTTVVGHRTDADPDPMPRGSIYGYKAVRIPGGLRRSRRTASIRFISSRSFSTARGTTAHPDPHRDRSRILRRRTTRVVAHCSRSRWRRTLLHRMRTTWSDATADAPRPQTDRRAPCRHRCRAARAIDLYPCAGSDAT